MFHFVEIYYGCKLFRIAPNFLCFEMEDALCGFNFSSKEVAFSFHATAETLYLEETDEKSEATHHPKDRRKQTPHRPLGVKEQRKKKRTPAGALRKRSPNYELPELDVDEMPKEWKKLLREAGFKRADLRNPALQGEIIQVLREHNIEVGEPSLSLKEARNVLPPGQLIAYEDYVEEVKAYEKQVTEDEAKEGYSVYDRKVLKGLKKWERDNPHHRPRGTRNTPFPVPQPKKVIRKKKRPFAPAIPVDPERLQQVKLRKPAKGKPRRKLPKSRLPELRLLSPEVQSTISMRLKQRLQARRRDLSVPQYDSDSDSDSSWLTD